MVITEQILRKDFLDAYMDFLNEERTPEEIYDFMNKTVEKYYGTAPLEVKNTVSAWSSGFFTGVLYMQDGVKFEEAD